MAGKPTLNQSIIVQIDASQPMINTDRDGDVPMIKSWVQIDGLKNSNLSVKDNSRK